ncbi:hypothetical protein GUITHDRAFT_132947 [Guillardia theta CCMP2712]|uniref:SAM domain-containing protein n=1 Tax=Guillardia theta (strain CCMP2712) TaxID=905079 RepID=L1JXX3_GUITC|nr:hypothetical protein GUITHDRAFT_132947 [Guillardia theta CCMP2712]EKX53184.1 hypothetical protein GUITHDRAFT_132947 [Guillardia theta CCMP2712]|eukprot:XP_005840164.1 hypothetical protein GUITHDRAFT_132947 [Guillardia theta CCMP2712]
MAMRLLIVLVMALLPWEGAGGSGGGGAGGAWSRVWMSRKTQDPLLLAGDAASNRIVLLERGSPRKIREWLVQQNHRNIVRLRGGQQSASLASALSSIGLERYVEVFEKEGIKPRNLESLTAPDLKELGMQLLNKLLAFSKLTAYHVLNYREVRMKIVQRVMVLCGSRDWDTRAAACKTMELIAAEVEEESLDAAAAGATAGDARAYSPSSHDDTLMFEPLKRLEILEEIKDSSLLFAQPANSIVDATPSNNVKGRKSVKGRLEAEKEKDQRDSTERELGEEMIVQYGGQGEGEEKDLSWVLSDVCKRQPPSPCLGSQAMAKCESSWHGAALVLKHVLKYHPCSTNKTIAKKEDDDVIRRSFVIECVVQLLRVLALDRWDEQSCDESCL